MVAAALTAATRRSRCPFRDSSHSRRYGATAQTLRSRRQTYRPCPACRMRRRGTPSRLLSWPSRSTSRRPLAVRETLGRWGGGGTFFCVLRCTPTPTPSRPPENRVLKAQLAKAQDPAEALAAALQASAGGRRGASTTRRVFAPQVTTSGDAAGSGAVQFGSPVTRDRRTISANSGPNAVDSSQSALLAAAGHRSLRVHSASAVGRSRRAVSGASAGCSPAAGTATATAASEGGGAAAEGIELVTNPLASGSQR